MLASCHPLTEKPGYGFGAGSVPKSYGSTTLLFKSQIWPDNHIFIRSLGVVQPNFRPVGTWPLHHHHKQSCAYGILNAVFACMPRVKCRHCSSAFRKPFHGYLSGSNHLRTLQWHGQSCIHFGVHLYVLLCNAFVAMDINKYRHCTILQVNFSLKCLEQFQP